ncbi:class I SAM-dependent methyltransferase [Aquibacillus koreensis]|uniref:Class I SAM-dependent methyltransferase n=1 Tax=Aquibacillus koreensis TaxID=279446 RepID=A0A9X3WLW7_9BACI|nr:class I SAM-dependent methyltransferase [Aquibacillus koreensis]MCT2534944.1 class I SAM-dependent methyltransferase [Aquibacillus koreensis]MDC3422162.1 class I SAM-dependent methyltransferase [Aquibacillus koreensis]
MKDTGERVIPEMMKPMNKLLLEHIARYQFALHYIKEGRILDLSCGSGYGAHMIAKEKKDVIEEIIGVDIDDEIITYAKGAYYHPQSSFQVHDATDPSLPEKLGQFDSIVSFETIEHIEEEQKLLDNYYHLLKPGGTLIVSTPFGEGRGIPCGSPFHVHQLAPSEFKELFVDYSSQEFFYQHGVLIEPEGRDVYYPLGIAVCTK